MKVTTCILRNGERKMPNRHKTLSTKKKSHYPAFQKASKVIADILMNHNNNLKCVRCQKKIDIPEPCVDRSINGFKLGKGKKAPLTMSSLPFSFISGTFVDTPYSLLCYKCTNFVKRSIGFIPEIYDSKYFPQVSAPMDFEELGNPKRKKIKWIIRFQGEETPHTKEKKARMMELGVKKYKHDFPECPHSESKLKRLVNGHELYDKMYGQW